MPRFSVIWIAWSAAGLGLCCPAMGQEAVKAAAEPQAQGDQKAQKPSEFLRLTKGKDGSPAAMETAIVRYVPINCGQTGPTVDLVAVVHIGEKDYYRKLNKEFKNYDAVLYELVAPEGTRIPKGGARQSSHPVSALQKGMTQLLQLAYQLNEVNYQAKNFVHADMSPEQLSKAMSNRGESLWTMMLRSMGYAMAKQHKPGAASDADILMALFDKNRALALKRVMADQFQDMEGMTRAMAGPDGSALIADRNRAALKVLKKQIAEGKGKVAIFYGAGHMSDLEQRLRDDFALTPIKTRWLVAWDLKGPSKRAGTPRVKPAAPSSN